MRRKGVYVQIQMWITPQQHKELKLAAAVADRPMTALVREAIARFLRPVTRDEYAEYAPRLDQLPVEVREP